jgi:hypothetical protein
MSDEAKKPRPSHTIRLTVWMLVGVLVGVAFAPAVGNSLDPWFRWRPLICTVSGALAGLAVELFRRFLDHQTNQEAKREFLVLALFVVWVAALCICLIR